MCLSPINIPNQTKYVSLKYRDRFLMQVPCGTCVECQKTMSNQWYYRAWYEWNDLIKSNGFALFDTLTYRPKDLPHLSRYWSELPKSSDYPCFDPSEIRKFIESLRIRIKRAGFGDCMRYFLASEYGTHRNYTHRPHYHIVLYIHNSVVDPLWLSSQIASLWKYGRTDGIPYKSRKYVLEHNTVFSHASIGTKLRTCHYVTKYVQKSCRFQEELNKRVGIVMWNLANFADPVTPDKWLQTEFARRERLKLLRYVNQFHRQSQHFGESALGDLDLNELIRDGCLYMPDTSGIKIPIPLPTYYKRKLFQEQVEFNGAKYWQLTDFGKYYKDIRQPLTQKILEDRYWCVIHQYHLPITDVSELVDYVFNHRGRIKGDLDESTLEERCNDIDFFNYSTPSDKLNFGTRGLTTEFLGESQVGYKTHHLFGRIPISGFIAKYCIFDAHFEEELEMIRSRLFDYNRSRESAFRLRQRLQNVYKPLNGK